MDSLELAVLSSSTFEFLKPYLPVIAGAAAEKIGGGLPAAAGNLWAAIKAKFAAKPAALEAEKDLLHAPDDPDLQAAFRVQLKKALEEDAEFAGQIQKLIQDLQTNPGQTATVVGSGVIVQGSHNQVVGPGGVMVKGDLSGNISTPKPKDR